jgi:hypothetical protein
MFTQKPEVSVCRNINGPQKINRVEALERPKVGLRRRQRWVNALSAPWNQVEDVAAGSRKFSRP